MLLLSGGMQGVFLATNLALFYVFWEVMLVPAYLLVGMYGGPRRAYAAIKFVLYTAVGSLLMLIAHHRRRVAGERPWRRRHLRPAEADRDGRAGGRAALALPRVCGGVCGEGWSLPAA